MKAVGTIIGACLIILLLGAVLSGITSFRSAEYEEPHNVTTAGGVTSANITLTQDLFNDDTAFATISSNDTDDAAVPSSYTAGTNTLLISGLAASTTRQLTVTYRYGQLGDYWGADLGARAWPLILVLGVFGVVAGAVVSTYSKRE
jgi:hypothetical protein